MSKRFFVRKSAAILGLIGALSMSLFNSCTQDNPTAPDKDVPSYTFSGSVLDGYTGKALGGAVVTYYDDKGDTVTTVTNADGGFTVTKIPYGDRSFFFSYRSTGTDTTKYTTAAVTLAGQDWENLGDNVDSLAVIIKNIAGAVKLYPLTGSISGTVLSQVNDRSELNAVASTVVKVTFTPKDNNQKDSTSVNGSNVEVGPRTFEATTAANGSFNITGLPVSGNADDKITIKVVSVTANGIDWAMVGDGIAVELVKGQSVPVGQIVLKPIVMDTLKALANNFKTGVVAPNDTFKITYSAALDTVASYAVLYSLSDARNVVVTTKISGKMIIIDPAYSLVNGNQYQIKTFAYGLKGSSAIDTFDVTVAGGGLADVVSSNILTDTKSPVYNVAKKVAITFTFTDSIVGQPSVRVTNNDISFSPLGKTLTINPKGVWKDGTVSVTVVLANGKTVSFSTALMTENALSYITSNVYDFNTNSAKNGLGLQDPIVFTTNKAINNDEVKVILTQGGVSLPTVVTVEEGDQQINIQPVNSLKAATSYIVTITVETESGESRSSSSSFTTTAAEFYPIFDNVRIGNDANMPRLDFAPNANIIVVMNDTVKKATASLTYLSGSTLTLMTTKVTVKADSIIIDPELILTEGVAYSLSLTAEDADGNTISGAYVNNFVPRALVIILASNIITADNQAIVNADRGITPWFKLSSVPVAASVKALITTPSIDAVVSVSGDTLFVNPVADFAYEATPVVTITGVATDGNYISFNKTFTVMKKPVISIVKSNVLNDNYEGAINVAEDIEMWYKLSRTPVAATVTAKTDGNNAVVRVNVDTVFVKATYVFNADATVNVEIHGVDSAGLKFDLYGNGTNWPAFKIRPALFPIASNTWGVKGNGDPVKNFAFYDTMWVKFSQNLSTNLLDITWNAAAPAVDVVVTADPTSNPNATAWVKGDTLFVLPDNRVAITYGKTVGFSVAVKTALGQASANTAFEVETTPLNLFVKATNTKDANGEMREDFNPFDTVFVVSSVSIDTILAVYSAATPAGTSVAVPDAGTGALRSRVRLSANGDTIFYVPATKLISGSTYSLDFDVRLKGESIGTSHGKALDISWKVKSGVVITAMNVMTNSSTFRPFKVIGDSLVVSFSKAIDTSASAPTLFTVNGFGALALTKVWSNGLKTVTIKNTDTLTARPYSIAANDYTTTNTTYDYTISFNVTCSDGEEKNALIGENSYVGKLAIKTEQKLALIGSNMVPSHTSNDAIAVGATPTDVFVRTSAPTLVFSRAIDTNAIKNDAVNQYQNFIKLVKNGTTLPLEFTLTFSNAAKTITITPVVQLDAAEKYDVVVTGIPALGMKNADAFTGAGNASSVLTNEDFETAPAPAIILTAKTTTIAADTPNGYTPMSYNGTVAEGHFMVRVWKTAWNANYADSVDGYQFRVRSFINGAWTSWYIISATAGIGGAYDPFSAQVNGTDRYFSSDVSVAGEASIYNALKVADGDGAVGSYQNGDRMLNDSTVVQIQSRAFVDNNGTKSYAQWSTALSYVDGVAPGDPIYGSTNVTVTPNFGVASIDRATNATIDSSNYIDVVFPEDMNIATTPVITFYDGANTGSTAPAVAASSKWLDARTYRFFIRLASGVNYLTAGPGEWYYKVSVNGMKDYSGVTLQNSGTAPAPAPGNNVLWANFGTTTAPVQGNLNAGAGSVGTGSDHPGFYLFP